ncbi:MAG TPA: peptidoglycan-binding protein [Thermoleophilaceae bacterium]|nr:peptidoglycan-binding protein [Thermoleophilaceae bacterium]
MNSVPADLTSRDLWSESLERSQARRRREGLVPGYSALELLPAQPRDLTDPEVWVRSGWRSRARREAAAHRNEMPAPSPRGLSVAALLALTGVPTAGVVSGALGGSDGAEAQAQARTASRGGGVSALQRALGVSADGVFGPQTEKAVKAYQRNHGLTVDGIAGPQTRSRLGIGSGPVLKRGGKARASGVRATSSVAARGGGVQALQRAIGVSADGVFGPQTEAALKRWQGSHGLTADGIAGPMTRAKAGLGPGPVLKRKSARGARGGGGDSRVAGVIAAANRIAGTPYKYGGGHGSFNDSGYDCSGSVSYALRGGGLIKAPQASSGLMSYGAPGPGKRITVYANSGHAYMVIDGRRFDTSARSQTGNRWTSERRSTAGYVARHPVGL